MEINGEQSIGTYDEHLEKLLETHECMCPKARELIEIIIKDMRELRKIKQQLVIL